MKRAGIDDCCGFGFKENRKRGVPYAERTGPAEEASASGEFETAILVSDARRIAAVHLRCPAEFPVVQVLIGSQPESFAFEERGMKNMNAEDRTLFLFEDAECNIQIHFQSARMARAFAATSSA